MGSGRTATSGPELSLPSLQLLVHGLERGLILHQHRSVLPLSPQHQGATGSLRRPSLPSSPLSFTFTKQNRT